MEPTHEPRLAQQLYYQYLLNGNILVKQYQQEFAKFIHLYLFQSSLKSHLDPLKMHF